jgi:hypothetical protein
MAYPVATEWEKKEMKRRIQTGEDYLDILTSWIQRTDMSDERDEVDIEIESIKKRPEEGNHQDMEESRTPPGERSPVPNYPGEKRRTWKVRSGWSSEYSPPPGWKGPTAPRPTPTKRTRSPHLTSSSESEMEDDEDEKEKVGEKERKEAETREETPEIELTDEQLEALLESSSSNNTTPEKTTSPYKWAFTSTSTPPAATGSSTAEASTSTSGTTPEEAVHRGPNRPCAMPTGGMRPPTRRQETKRSPIMTRSQTKRVKKRQSLRFQNIPKAELRHLKKRK